MEKLAPFALVLLLAICLRVRGLDTTTIGGDQAFTLGTAMRWVNGGDVPLAANISSVGFMNPPMIEYLYAAALRIWPDIISVALLTFISGIVAMIAAGWATYKVFGRGAAFWTMLIFAINPWSVYYSQLIWNQTMVPVFSTLMFVSVMLYFASEQRPIYLLSAFVWAACMTQVHPGSTTQLLTMGLILCVFWRRLRPRPLLAGVGIFLLLYLPFLLFESGVGWRDVNRILELMGQPAHASIASVLVSFDLMQVQGLQPNLKGVTTFDNLATLLLAVAIVITLWLGSRSFNKRKQVEEMRQKFVATTVLALWFFVPLLFYLRSSDLVYVQPYYLVGQIPAHFMFIGIALDWAQNRVRWLTREEATELARGVANFGRWFVVPLPLLILLGWQTVSNLQFQDSRLQNEPVETQIRHVRSAIYFANQLMAEQRECQLVIISEGHSVEQSHLSLIREFTVPEQVLFADGRYALPLPSPCVFYLDSLPGSRASDWLAVNANPVPGAEIDVPRALWRFYELSTEGRIQTTSSFAPSDGSLQWTNGVALRRYDRSEVTPGATLPIALYWSVVTSPPEALFHFGTYLLDGNDELIAQYDGPGFDSIQWRVGDDFITWTDIPIAPDLPGGEYQLAVALYSWPDVARVNLGTGENIAILERFQFMAP